MEERDLNCSEEKSYCLTMGDFATKATKIRCFCRKDTTNSPSSYQKRNNNYTAKTHHSDFLDNRESKIFWDLFSISDC